MNSSGGEMDDESLMGEEQGEEKQTAKNDAPHCF